MDPFLDLIRLIQPRATLFGAGLEASGRWALGFRQRDDLLFCWIERGACLLLRPGQRPLSLEQGDFALVRTSTPFTLASDVDAATVDSASAVAATGSHRLQLGSGTDNPVILQAGKFLFNPANPNLLMGLLPALVHVARGDASSTRVRLLLAMTETETQARGPGSGFVIVRLMELLLVELARTAARPDHPQAGLLAGLADPATARALTAMHGDVAHAWTVASLASLCAMSRSSFATRFHTVVGVGPIAYLQDWRMALARDKLRAGALSIGAIAAAVGFQSQSAFSTAFTRCVGCTPTSYAASTRNVQN